MTEITAGGTIYIRRAPTDGQPGKDGADGQPGADGADGKDGQPAWSLRLADGSTSIALSTDDLTENAAHNFAVDAATDGRTLEIKAYYGNKEAYADIEALETTNCAAAQAGNIIGVAKLKLKTISGQAAQYDGETATDTDGNPIYMPVGAATIALTLTVKDKLIGTGITEATLALTIPITIAYTKDIARFYHDSHEFTSQIAQLSTTADGLQSQVSEIKQTAANISLQVGTAEQIANSAKEAADNAANEAADANSNATEAAKEAQAAANANKETKDDLLATGIDIKNRQITVTTDQFRIRNNANRTTAKVNKDGVLECNDIVCNGGTFKGTVSASQFVMPSEDYVFAGAIADLFGGHNYGKETFDSVGVMTFYHGDDNSRFALPFISVTLASQANSYVNIYFMATGSNNADEDAVNEAVDAYIASQGTDFDNNSSTYQGSADRGHPWLRLLLPWPTETLQGVRTIVNIVNYDGGGSPLAGLLLDCIDADGHTGSEQTRLTPLFTGQVQYSGPAANVLRPYALPASGVFLTSHLELYCTSGIVPSLDGWQTNEPQWQIISHTTEYTANNQNGGGLW